MDCVSPLFSFENDLVHLSPLPSLQPLPIFSKDIINESDVAHKPKLLAKSSKRNRPSISCEEKIYELNPHEDNKKRRMMHRDVERLRRQEMTTLYSSLRALLPLDYLKGKRSVCDHMNEAVNYIKHLQGKIQALSNKRDELRKLSTLIPNNEADNVHNSMPDNVMVRPTWAGLEIILEIPGSNGLSLSRVLQVLVREQLEIVACNSTKTNEGLFHIIQTKLVENGGDINLLELQEKLANMICFSFDDVL